MQKHIQLRKYQNEAVNEISLHFHEGITRQLICIPTGGGKTVIFATVIKDLGKKALVIAHRDELLTQARNTIKSIYPEAEAGIFKGNQKDALGSKICITTIQTAIRHTESLLEQEYKVLVCDEAHHAACKSYINLFDRLGFMNDDKDKLLLGVTATPFRNDDFGLGDVFEKVVHEQNIGYMIENGYLCNVRGISIDTGINIAGIKEHCGDFDCNSLSRVIDVPERNSLIAEMYTERGEKRPGVIFCANIQHAISLADTFSQQGIKCKAVYGSMPLPERQKILDEYAEGKIDLLSNVGVLTEGWDAPRTSIIIMARPTKSKLLYIQCVGRGLRLSENKNDYLIMDFVDIAKHNSLCTFSDLEKSEFFRPECHRAFTKQNAQNNKPLPEIYVPSKSECKVVYFDPLKRVRQNWKAVDVTHIQVNLMSGNTLWICQSHDNAFFFALTDANRRLIDFHFGNIDDRTNAIKRANASDCTIKNFTSKNYYVLVPNGILWCYSCCMGFGYSIFVDIRGTVFLPFGSVAPVGFEELMRRCDTYAWSLIHLDSYSCYQNPITDKQKYVIQQYSLYHSPDTLNSKQAWEIIHYFRQLP